MAVVDSHMCSCSNLTVTRK